MISAGVELKKRKMKRLSVVVALVVSIVIVFLQIDFEQFITKGAVPERKECTGYEVIEAGKGINCYGDTIKLTRRRGFYEVASNKRTE
jgi:hypothetical protein